MSNQRCGGKPGQPWCAAHLSESRHTATVHYCEYCTGCADCSPAQCGECGKPLGEGEGWYNPRAKYSKCSGCLGITPKESCKPEPSETKLSEQAVQFIKRCRSVCSPDIEALITFKVGIVELACEYDAAIHVAYQRGYRQSEVDDNWDGVDDEGYVEGKDNE